MLALLKGKAVKHIMEWNTNSISLLTRLFMLCRDLLNHVEQYIKQITTAKTTRRLPNKRLNELNNSCARELEITFALVLAVLWKTT